MDELRTLLRTSWSAFLVVVVVGCGQEQAPVREPNDAPPASSASDDPVAQRIHLSLDNAMAGWVPSGMTVAAGDSVALFASGTVEADGAIFEPRHLLWYRVGTDSGAIQFAANQETFTAPSGGEIFVTLRPAAIYWSDRRGTYPEGFTSAAPVPIDINVELLRFGGQVGAGLTALAAANNVNAQAALDAVAARKTLPDGFEHLWFLARSNVWAEGALDGRPGITADTDDDVSIVKLPLDLPLSENTQFVFDWRYDSLPALGPETAAQFHDYLSVALEFDNGQDLTWMWSTELPNGTHFGCPLPGWENKETHWVLQSGDEGLGQWFTHERNVLEDYRASIEGEAPSRIVGVWFIANSLFGRQRAAASFAEVAILDGASRRDVFQGPALAPQI